MKTVAKENLIQLKKLVCDISSLNYNKKPDVLLGASIGEHMRHILEFYQLLVVGSTSGTISYDKRTRSKEIESDPTFALQFIDKLLISIDKLNENLQVEFEADYSVSGTTSNLITSSVGRELAYCIEHSIHHQAMIKAGLVALGLKELTDKNFGVAYSTIRYRNSTCVQ